MDNEDIYKFAGESEKETYQRRRIHELVDKIALATMQLEVANERVHHLQDDVKSNKEDIQKLKTCLYSVENRLTAIEGQLNLLNRILWIFISGGAAYACAKIFGIGIL